MVLVIDDDPTVAGLVAGLLSAGGEGLLDVESAATLVDGLAMIRRSIDPPCVVLLDLRLPDSDGHATLAACLDVCRNKCPIIVLTADGDRSLAVSSLREGADDFLLKSELTARALSRAIRYSIERTQHRAAMVAAEAQTSAVFRSIDSMIAILDATGNLLAVNDAWHRFARETGCPVMNAADGNNLIDFCRALDHPFADVVLSAVESLLDGRQTRFEQLVTGVPPYGKLTHLRLRGCPIDLANGRGVALVVDDFTEKFLAEQALAEAASRMTVALEAGHVGTFNYEIETGLVEWSPWHYRIVGIDPSGFDGTVEGFFRFVHPDDRERILKDMEAARIARAPLKVAYRIVRPCGEIRLIEAEARYAYDDDGNAVRLSGAIVDATDRRVAMERQGLSQRLEALGELSAGIAHDLRNTLSLARAALGRLEEASRLDPAASLALADLRLANQQATQLVGSLVDFAKPAHARPAQVVDLNGAVLSFVSFLRRLLPNSLRVSVECGSEPAYISADPVHVQQVVMNLVLNSRDAMNGVGEVTVRVKPAAGERGASESGLAGTGRAAPRSHLLEVVDNGPGIPESAREHIFELFFTGRSGRQGSGLGLAIVKTILDSCSADIRLDSAPGQGARFRIQWPAATLGPERTPVTMTPGSVEQSSSSSVLLIQPPGYPRRVLADGLAELGLRVCEVDSIDSITADLTKAIGPPAVIVLDDEVAIESWRRGLESLRRRGWSAPVVVLTAEPGALDDETFLAVAKPFSVGQVCAAVRAVIDEDEGDEVQSTMNAQVTS
jgi:signal transduction histidine kinase/DNA-binding response OmpR family regulator